MYIKNFFIFFLLTSTALQYCASSSSLSSSILAMSGIDGLGSSREYVANLLNVSHERIIQADIPRGWLFDGKDLGQAVCMGRFLSAVPRAGKFSVHASSQGAGAALNAIAKMSAADQSRIETIIVEGGIVSGNSAIMAGVHRYYVGFLRYLPFAYYIAPYLIKVRFPRYWPAGPQAIKSIDTISPNIPVIIVHAEGDSVVPYPDACALYYGLRAQGRDNVYFIRLPGRRHVSLLESHEDRELLRKIVARHQVTFQSESHILPLTEDERLTVQPSYLEYRELYERLRMRERNHTKFSWMLFLATFCAAYHMKAKITRVDSALRFDSIRDVYNLWKMIAGQS